MANEHDTMHDDDAIHDDGNSNVADDSSQDGSAHNDPPVVASPNSEDDDAEFANMTPRERALVTRARAQEKNKLYKELNTARNELRDANRRIRDMEKAPTPRTPEEREDRNNAMEDLRGLVSTLSSQIQNMREQQETRERQSELRAYRNERIAELRRNGDDVIESLVGGDSEDEIDQSIEIARAEYKYTEMKIAEKQSRQNPRRGVPSTVHVSSANGRPAGTPPATTTGSVNTEDQESITDLTSDDAVRNGAYEKNRNRLLSTVKRRFRYTGNPAQQ